MDPGGIDNSLPVGITPLTSRLRFVCLPHTCDTLSTIWKLIQYI
jgi:hypothetical protein